MRILVFSDTHRDIASCIRVIENIIGVDMVLHAGDHISDAREICRQFPNIEFEYVPGNCDFSSDDTEVVIEAEGKKIFLTHGHRYSVKTDENYSLLKERAKSLGCDCAVFGHTHISLADNSGDIALLNPGSIKQSGTYGVIEIENGVLKTAVCTVRTQYNVFNSSFFYNILYILQKVAIHLPQLIKYST